MSLQEQVCNQLTFPPRPVSCLRITISLLVYSLNQIVGGVVVSDLALRTLEVGVCVSGQV